MSFETPSFAIFPNTAMKNKKLGLEDASKRTKTDIEKLKNPTVRIFII